MTAPSTRSGGPTRRTFLVATATGAAVAGLAAAGVQPDPEPEQPYHPGGIEPQIELHYVHPGKVFTAEDMNRIIRSIQQLQARGAR